MVSKLNLTIFLRQNTIVLEQTRIFPVPDRRNDSKKRDLWQSMVFRKMFIGKDWGMTIILRKTTIILEKPTNILKLTVSENIVHFCDLKQNIQFHAFIVLLLEFIFLLLRSWFLRHGILKISPRSTTGGSSTIETALEIYDFGKKSNRNKLSIFQHNTA